MLGDRGSKGGGSCSGCTPRLSPQRLGAGSQVPTGHAASATLPAARAQPLFSEGTAVPLRFPSLPTFHPREERELGKAPVTKRQPAARGQRRSPESSRAGGSPRSPARARCLPGGCGDIFKTLSAAGC